VSERSLDLGVHKSNFDEETGDSVRLSRTSGSWWEVESFGTVNNKAAVFTGNLRRVFAGGEV
jgi:hypothetical protein